MLRPTAKAKEKRGGNSTCRDERGGAAAVSSKVLENLQPCMKELGVVSGRRLDTKQKIYLGDVIKKKRKREKSLRIVIHICCSIRV